MARGSFLATAWLVVSASGSALMGATLTVDLGGGGDYADIFLGGQPPALGRECIPIPGCPEKCGS